MTDFMPIIEALERYDYNGYVELLRNVRNINFQDNDGNTLLHKCVTFCNYPCLLYTMGKKANVDLENIHFSFINLN